MEIESFKMRLSDDIQMDFVKEKLIKSGYTDIFGVGRTTISLYKYIYFRSNRLIDGGTVGFNFGNSDDNFTYTKLPEISYHSFSNLFTLDVDDTKLDVINENKEYLNKFKVWCTHHNEWEDDVWLLTSDGKLLDDKNNSHILVKSTGLLDVNNKLIYEYDFVELDNGVILHIVWNKHYASFVGLYDGESVALRSDIPYKVVGVSLELKMHELIEVLEIKKEINTILHRFNLTPTDLINKLRIINLK